MSKTKIVLTFLLVWAVYMGVDTFFLNKTKNKDDMFVTIGQKGFVMKIADTDEERGQGLSGTTQLSNGEGMIFIFDTPGKYGFWMKDMSYPIDIIWVDKNMKIVYIEKSLDPNTYPKVYYPNSPALYVLEIPAGVSESSGFKIGDKIEFLEK